MTMVAKVDILAPESSHRFPPTGTSHNKAMSDKEVENLVEMVEKVAEMKGETQVQMEKIVAQELLQMASFEMTKDKAETAVKVMEQVEDLDMDKAKTVIETLEENDNAIDLNTDKVEKSQFQNPNFHKIHIYQSLIFHKINIFNASFFTKFTSLKSHFSQN